MNASGGPAKILHLDMDAFYASIEERRHPELARHPLLIGAPPGHRGIVCTCNYLARRYGVHSAMSTHRALRLCPHAQLLPPDLAHYRLVSKALHTILRQYSSCIEPLSLDEAYLQLPGDQPATPMAYKLQQQVQQQLGLSCSIGVSYNKFLAKMASGHRKPHGMTVVPPQQATAFLSPLPIARFYGVGPRLSASLKQRLGVSTGADLLAQSLDRLLSHYGQTGYFLYQAIRGIDDRPVSPPTVPKSISRESTFTHDLTQLAPLRRTLDHQLAAVLAEMALWPMQCRCLTVTVRYHDYRRRSRSQHFPGYVSDPRHLHAVAQRLLPGLLVEGKSIRLLGVGCSQLLKGHIQPTLPWPEAL